MPLADLTVRPKILQQTPQPREQKIYIITTKSCNICKKVTLQKVVKQQLFTTY
jgi:hypothetical protein